MAVFISYSHNDSEFVDKLGALLFKQKTAVWLDRWELNVGDSLIQRIQEAISKASAVIFVLSRASVDSDWCKKELSAGLIRELEEQKVVVLPILLEDCTVPLFLRDKKYADFRTNFDRGFKEIVAALARVASDTQGRIEKDHGFIDWSWHWSIISENEVRLELVAVQSSNTQPITLLTRLEIELNERASQRHIDLLNADFEPFARQLVLSCLTEGPVCDDLFVYLDDSAPQERTFGMGDPKIGVEFRARAVVHRLGEDTGKDLAFNLGIQLRDIAEQSLNALAPLTRRDRVQELSRIMSKYRADFPRL